MPVALVYPKSDDRRLNSMDSLAIRLKRVLAPILSALIAIALPSLGRSDAGETEKSFSYSFGGSCPSQGLWTQSVATHSGRIRDVIKGLKENPACKGFRESTLQYLSTIEASLAAAEKSSASDSAVNHDRRQLEFSAEVMNLQPRSKGLSNLVVTRASEYLAKQAGFEIANKTLHSARAAGKQMQRETDGIIDLFQNLNSYYIANLNCLGQDLNTAGQIFSSSVYMLSAVASSGHNSRSAKFSRLISDIAKFAQDLKFSGTLNRINELEYFNSVRCLIETTQENYCGVLDGMEMLRASSAIMTKQSKVNLNELPKVDINVTPSNSSELLSRTGNPLAGIYIMTHHLPVVTSYIQRLLLGVRPNIPEEATFQNKTLNSINALQMQTKNIQAKLALDMRNILSITDEKVQGNKISDLIVDLSVIIINDRNVGENFFLYDGQEKTIPFFLLGLNEDQYPDAVFNPKAGGYVMSWTDYFRTFSPVRGGVFGVLKNPKELLPEVEKRMNLLIEKATARANQYYGTWFLADASNLLDEALVQGNFRYSVRDSLKSLHDYIVILERRLKSLGQRPLPSMPETRQRLARVIEHLDEYQKIDFQTEASNSAIESREIQKKAEQIRAEQKAELKRDFDEFGSKIQLLNTQPMDGIAAMKRLLETEAAQAAAIGGQVRNGEANSEIDKFNILEKNPLQAAAFAKARWTRMRSDTESRMNLLAKTVSNESHRSGSFLNDRSIIYLTQIYLELNVLLSRSTLLSNRFDQFVLLDYKTLLDAGVDFSDYQKSMMIAMGPQLLGELRIQLEKPWAQVFADLQNAQNLASENFNRVEEVFRDPFIKFTGRVMALKDNNSPGATTHFLNSALAAYRSSNLVRRDLNNPILDLGNVIGSPLIFLTAAGKFLINPDRYDRTPLQVKDFWSVRSTDTGHGAANYLWTQMCTQGLGFSDPGELRSYCRGAVLKSAAELVGMPLEEINVPEKKSLNLSMNYSLWQTRREKIESRNSSLKGAEQGQAKAKDRDQRICALRNYYRDNYVFQMLLGANKN
jgi:hypothetical protein